MEQVVRNCGKTLGARQVTHINRKQRDPIIFSVTRPCRKPETSPSRCLIGGNDGHGQKPVR